MPHIQPTLSLWDEPTLDHSNRVVAHSTDRVAWLRARSRGITATDAARLATDASVTALVRDKMLGTSFGGNAFTDHGREREPAIAQWVHHRHGITASSALYHAEHDRQHLATPDGVAVRGGTVVLAEIKTTSTPWKSVPRAYLRQVWWQQYVLGAERTLLVWEQHDNFVPVHGEPQHLWVDRDDDQIHMLVARADRVLATLRGIHPTRP